MPLNCRVLAIACLLLGVTFQAQAAYIQRSITIDGNVSDWTTPTDITNNTTPYQYSTDAMGGAGDPDNPGQVARDLKKFSFTWDATYVYFYVETWGATNNIHWLFYIDTQADGKMNSTDKVLDVVWQSNGTTNSEVFYYVPDITGGDDLTGDGAAMPGTVGTSIIVYPASSGGVTSGPGDKLQMETRVTWSDLGFPGGPTDMKFHISSALNTTSLPGSVIDNMDGPAGGSLFPKDLQISQTASPSPVKGLKTITYIVSVYNASIDPMTSVTISDVLPTQVTYVNSSDNCSGTFTDNNSDSIPDLWSIGSVAANTTCNLTITVTANSLPAIMDIDNTATLTASTPADEENSNDSAMTTVTIEPIPQLTTVKYASTASADPGTVITYTLDITNGGGDDGYSVVIDDQLSPYVALKIDNGSGHPFDFQDNMGNPSGLSLGTRSYSADYGVDGYSHPLTDRGDGYDNNVTNFKIIMTGTMNKKVSPATGGNFTIQYDVIVK